MKEINVEADLLKEKKPFRIEEFAKGIGAGVDVVRATIEQLKTKGYVFYGMGEYIIRSRNRIDSQVMDLRKRFDRNLRFGIVSDSHLVSKMERLDALHATYDIFEREGITTVFHAGDVTDGWGVYRGQEFEVTRAGQQEQVDYTVINYPKKKGITTYFITGNHDLRQFERGGVDVGHPIARARRDLVYMGQASAHAIIGNGVEMEMVHPDGNVAYAVSYKAQRDINNRSPNSIPDILVYGHYHTSFYMHYRGIEFLQAPCFKDAGVWEKRKGLNPTIGAWLVDARLDGDLRKIETFKPNLMNFEEKRFR